MICYYASFFGFFKREGSDQIVLKLPILNISLIGGVFFGLDTSL